VGGTEVLDGGESKPNMESCKNLIGLVPTAKAAASSKGPGLFCAPLARLRRVSLDLIKLNLPLYDYHCS